MCWGTSLISRQNQLPCRQAGFFTFSETIAGMRSCARGNSEPDLRKQLWFIWLGLLSSTTGLHTSIGIKLIIMHADTGLTLTRV